MRVLILLSLVTLTLTARLKEERAPTFTFMGNDRSVNGLPIISVKFPNGISDSLVLQKFDAGIDLPVAETKECNYIGHLASEPEACLALTGCPGIDDFVEMTILSEHFPGIFKWYKDGRVENVQTPHEKVSKPRSLVKDVDDSNIADAETKALKPVPTTNNLSVRFGYDDHFREKVGGTDAKAEAYWKKAATHLQAWFCHSSLGTKIKLTTLSMKHYKGLKLTAAETDDIRMVNTTIKDLNGADLMVYFAFDKTGVNANGPAGVAHLGGVCDTRPWGTPEIWDVYDGYKHSITQWQATGIQATAWIAAHEIGHNLGMWHDFDPRHGGWNSTCNKQRGVMSYSMNPNYKHPWSTCSKNDFQKQYNNILSMEMTWCLEAVSSNFCASSGTGLTTKNG